MIGLPTKIVSIFAILGPLGAAAPHYQYNSCPSERNCSSKQRQCPETVGKAVYFLTNEAENAVVALPIGKDGKLSNGTITKTGGAGSIAVDGATNQPAIPDALISQSALVVAGNVSQVAKIPKETS